MSKRQICEHREELASIAANSAASGVSPDLRELDVFVAHATEDKDAIARPLAHALRDLGLEVWYDEFELRIGDTCAGGSTRASPGAGSGSSCSRTRSFAKQWSQYELDGLVTMAVGGNQVLLPLWHEISKDEVIKQSPSLADKVALRTSDYSIDEIASEIASVVRST